MIKAAHIFAIGLASLTVPVSAAEITLDGGARQLGFEPASVREFSIPTSTFANGAVVKRPLSGTVSAESWSFPLGGRTTSDLMNDLRAQLAAQGYSPLLDCIDAECGGFDFRYQLDLLPEPEMHVDLGDFRYLSAFKPKPNGAIEYLQLVVSRSAISGFVQLTTIGHEEQVKPVVSTSNSPDVSVDAPLLGGRQLADNLLEFGFAKLGDLTFATGSSDLDAGPFKSLAELGSFLSQNGDLTIALVGHTDAVGSLSANMVLARKRAQSVLDRLATEYGIARGRMEADGVGYLAPIASNLSEDGRTKNRRVEVVITSTR